MAAQQLNVRVGFLFDSKGLAALERSLRASGERLSRIGQNISLSISAPLALLGGAAIKSAGDIESLTLALKSQLGTSAAAAKELQLLTDAAKNPGLGLEQAVRGSVRLQGVKLSAEEAREVLVQMGNAIAATGGSAQELDNVTRQFAQMISKGRVLQEDVSILSENMPGLAGLMEKAFGTQSVEAIRKMGVGGKEFVLAITEAAKELPRVEGGIKNSIGNALDSLKQSAAKVGLAINQAFDVTGGLETLSSFLLRLAEGFASLDPTIQKTILGIAGLAAASGPLVSVWGSLKQTASLLVGAWGGMVSGMKALSVWAGNVATEFNALNLATRAFILIGVVTAVVALANEMGAFSRELTAAEKTQRLLNDITGKAAASFEGERSKVAALANTVNDGNKKLSERKAALNELQRISPKYFGGLEVEKGKYLDLSAAVKGYVDALVASKVVKDSVDEIAKIKEGLVGLSDAADPTLYQKAGNALQSLVLGPLAGGLAFEKLNEQTREFNKIDILKSSNERIAALEGLISANISLASTVDNVSNTSKFAGKNLGELSDKAKVLKEVLSDISNATAGARILGEDEDLAKVEALTSGIRKLLDAGFQPASAEVQNLKSQLDALAKSPIILDTIAVKPVSTDPIKKPDFASSDPNGILRPFEVVLTVGQQVSDLMERLNGGVLSFGEAFARISGLISESGTLMQQAFVGMGAAISQAAASGEASFGSLANAALGAAAKIVRAWIQQGVAAAVAKALSSIPFPFNLAAGAAAGGIAAALFTKAIGSIGVKGFARGTRNAPGGLALVGEEGPELINLPRRSQVFTAPQTNRMLDNFGGGHVTVGGEFRVKGTDLVLVLEMANSKNKRFY